MFHSAIGVPQEVVLWAFVDARKPRILASPQQMVSRLWSGFRHLRHERDVNAQRWPGCRFPSFAPNSFEPILRLLESRCLESTIFGLTRSQPTSRLLLHASRRRYSNPQLSRLFRNASPNATFPQADHSSEADAECKR